MKSAISMHYGPGKRWIIKIITMLIVINNLDNYHAYCDSLDNYHAYCDK